MPITPECAIRTQSLTVEDSRAQLHWLPLLEEKVLNIQFKSPVVARREERMLKGGLIVTNMWKEK